MLVYYPIPDHARRWCGVAYVLDTDQEISLSLAALMPQLQVVLTGAARHCLHPGQPAQAMGQVSLVGATHRATSVTLSPGSRVIGLGLLPEGLRLAAKVPANDLADTLIDAAGIWGDGLVDVLAQRLAEATTGQAASEILFDFVAGLATRSSLSLDPRSAVVEAWLARAGESNVHDLAAYLGLSNRQVERLTARSHGASPKQLEVKYRALRLAADMALGKAAPLRADRDAGDYYYDQSHRIRDFSRFVGCTPAQFERDQAEFARTMLIGRWRAGARSATSL